MMKRINITIDNDLLNRIDSYTKKRYGSRSGLIAFVLSSFFDNVETDPDVLNHTTSPVKV